MVPKYRPIRIKQSPAALLIFFIGCGVGYTLYPTLTESPAFSSSQPGEIKTCFSPKGQCTKQIVSAVVHAKSSILVQAYSFTSPQIAHALLDAHQKGVAVKVILDKSQLTDKYSQLSSLSKAGIPILIDSPSGIAHNKVMVIDDRYVLTGSFNFTRASEARNAENILLIDNPELARLYIENWHQRARKSRQLKRSWK